MAIMIMRGTDGVELSEDQSRHEWWMMLGAGNGCLAGLPDASDGLPKMITEGCGLVRSACKGLGEPIDWVDTLQERLLATANNPASAQRADELRAILAEYDIGASG